MKSLGKTGSGKMGAFIPNYDVQISCVYLLPEVPMEPS
jgi:hypothetical protein